MSKLGGNIIVLTCAGLLAGCAGIPAVRKDTNDIVRYHAIKILSQPNVCGSGGDPATGNYSEGFPGFALPPGSPAASYGLDWGSLAGGLSGTGSYSLEPQDDGSIKLTLPDGTIIWFVPSGTLNPELTGNLPQFDHVAGYQGLLVLSGGQYSLTEKDGTKTSFIKSGDVYRPSVLTDRNGGTLSYAYNASGKLTGITDVHSRSISITYNAAGKPATVADFTNRTASFEYDVSGNPTKATDLDGSQTVYAYDGSGRMTDINYPNGAHKTMTYDNKNRVLTIAEDGGNNAQTGSDVTDCLRDILARYEASPFIIKSDRAKVFLCSQWLGLLSVNGITPHKIRPHCPQDQGIIERGMREVKTWLRANNPVSEEFPVCLDEGMFMLNFLKPKMVLNAATPAAVYLGNKMSAVCDKSKREVLCIAS